MSNNTAANLEFWKEGLIGESHGTGTHEKARPPSRNCYFIRQNHTLPTLTQNEKAGLHRSKQ